jgi:hypothetical protein
MHVFMFQRLILEGRAGEMGGNLDPPAINAALASGCGKLTLIYRSV